MDTEPVAAPAQPAPIASNPDIDPGPGPSAPSAPARIDTEAYLRDRRDGARTATEPVESKSPAEPVAPAPERRVSKRQEDTNDRIRESVERATADLRAEVERLRAANTPTAAPAAEPAKVTQAEYKRFLALPDAPKIDDFESIAEHTAAMALFITDQRWAEHSQRGRADAESQALTAAQGERADTYAKAIKDAVAADAAFWDGISPDVANLTPLAALKPGQPAGPRNLVAEEVLSSPVSPQLMRELSKPGALARLETVPDSLKNLPPKQRVVEHARWIVREIGKLEASLATAPAAPGPKLVTTAEPPPARLGTKPNVPDDPVEAALKRKDTGAYLEERRKQDLAKRR